jgi:sulfite exporter TauE/SafE
MALSIIISAWLAGALGGVHCVAMCGGLMTTLAARDARLQPLLPRTVLARRQGITHAGRLVSYALLGAAFGSAGTWAFVAADLAAVQQWLYVGANVLLLALAIGLVWRMPPPHWMKRLGATVFGALLPMLRPALGRGDTAGRFVFGIAWGLVPCGLVYSVLPLALFAGGAAQGSAVMIAFGLGTLPNLVVTGLVLRRANRALAGARFRYGAAALIGGFAVVGIVRAFGPLDTLARGAFCFTV